MEETEVKEHTPMKLQVIKPIMNTHEGIWQRFLYWNVCWYAGSNMSLTIYMKNN